MGKTWKDNKYDTKEKQKRSYKKPKHDLENWDSTRKMSLIQEEVKQIEKRETHGITYGKLLRHLEGASSVKGLEMLKVFKNAMLTLDKDSQYLNHLFIDIVHIITHTETEFKTLQKTLIHRWSVKRGQEKLNNVMLGKFSKIEQGYNKKRYYQFRTEEIKSIFGREVITNF